MPYKSLQQEKYIFMEANKGEKWAKKFVKDSKGKSTKGLPKRVKPKK